MGKLTDEERMSLATYKDSHPFCAVCHWEETGRKWGKDSPLRRLEIHHIIPGRHGGKDCHDHKALLILCTDCHYGFHSGGGCSLSLGHVLTAKEELGELDTKFLAGLRNRAGLKEDPQPLPLWATESRKDNHGFGHSPKVC